MISSQDLNLLDSPPGLGLEGRVAWITGASRGLGRTIAFAFAGAGAEVVLSARNGGHLAEISEAIAERGGTSHVVVGSVTEEADVAAAVETIADRCGRLDVLVNNAGISPYFVRSERLEPAAMRELLDTNLVGAFDCCRAAFGLLELSPAASVVNVSSVHGSRSHERMLAYAVTKGGMEMLTRTLADEWADRGIRVNSLAPGYITTEMTEGLRDHERWNAELTERTPLGRFATTQEIAACALFLAAPISGYVTGTTLFADGGWSAR
ncbi:MAG: SDR family NAD(P)-dependent oxidoreductase [Solirubrobacterales bacterium]